MTMTDRLLKQQDLEQLEAARAEAGRWRQQHEALRSGAERIAQDLLSKTRTAISDGEHSGNPYHDGQADAYDQAEQMVRSLLDEAGGGGDG